MMRWRSWVEVAEDGKCGLNVQGVYIRRKVVIVIRFFHFAFLMALANIEGGDCHENNCKHSASHSDTNNSTGLEAGRCAGRNGYDGGSGGRAARLRAVCWYGVF